MAYKITFKKSVAKDLKRLGKQHAECILDKIDAELAENPDRFPALTGPFAGLRKFRVGDYRVIFALMDDKELELWTGSTGSTGLGRGIGRAKPASHPVNPVNPVEKNSLISLIASH